MKAKLYLETTIPSYLTARPSRDLIVAAHQQITHEWWEKRRHDFGIFISQFVVDEAGQGDEAASQRRLEISIKIKSVCKAKGYECPIICTPEELMGED